MTATSSSQHKEISDWLGDIVALESHVEEAMDHQLKLETPNAELTATFKSLHDAVRDSKHRAEEYQKSYGSTAGNPIIKVGSELLGKAAGLIDKARKDSASKALRDDAPAFSMLNVAYGMLHTTAVALSDDRTAQFAKTGMHTYAHLAQEVSRAIPLAVVEELKTGDHADVLNPGAVETARQALYESWQQTSA